MSLGRPAILASRCALGAMLLGATLIARVQAGAPSVAQLRGMTLAQLANITVTTAARTPQALSQVPAALYVITSEDIRQAGAESLPQALRLAPNLEVARVNAYDWTISARGFNSPESANKLLVLIDGRSVYSPLAGTVFWDQLDVPMDNVKRIEVISGPGGSLWGANAMNGVINVITKSPAETQGLFAHVTGGAFTRSGTVRYGGKLDADSSFALTLNGFDDSATDPVNPADSSRDAWRGGEISASFAHQLGPDRVGGFAMAYNNGTYDSAPVLAGVHRGTNLWGQAAGAQWRHTRTDGASWQVRATFSRDGQVSPALHEALNAYDVESQYNFADWGAHSLIVGAEVKDWRETLYSANAFHFAQPTDRPVLGDIYVQDTMQLRPSLRLTAGVEGEYNSYSGGDYLPNLRLSWNDGAHLMLWAGVSRAVRTPSRIDRELQALPVLAPSLNFQSEKLTAYQLGYRGTPAANLTLSLSLYYNHYHDLRTDAWTNGGLPIHLTNGAEGATYGAEFWGRYAFSSSWRVSFGADWLNRHFRLRPGASDLSFGQSLGQDPPWQVQLRTAVDLTSHLELDLGLRGIGAVMRYWLGGSNLQLVPSYAEADARLVWKITDRTELSFQGFNLLHNRHLEVNDLSTAPARYIPRYFVVSLRTHL